MLKTELLELLRNGESSGVEFKIDTIASEALAKELVGFANLQGGMVLLGVDDEGTIQGITRGNLEEWVMTTCRDKIRPELIPYFETIRGAAEGRDVAAVSVSRGWTVHCRWHHNHRTYYIRVGTTTREASPEELERLFQQRGHFRVELRPVSGSGIRDLDLRRLSDYFRRVRQQNAPEDEEGWRQLLTNTELLLDESEAHACTVAGLLLFGQNPIRFLPQSGIDAVAYPGVERDYAARERATLKGPLAPLLQTAPEVLSADPRQGIVENGLVDQALDFVQRNIGVSASLEGGARRVERKDYPLDAVREALVNAVVHRDYLLSSTSVELSIFSDRLEVVSPGALPNGITPERMRAGCRAARNQLLKDVMRDYGYLEHMGMGIPRKIIRLMKEHNGTEPDLLEDGERFIVRLWKEPRRTGTPSS